MNSSLLVSSFSLLYAIKQVWCLNGRDLRKNGNKMDLLLAISTEWNCWENMFSLFRYVLSLILFHSFIQLACSCSIFSIISFRSHLLTPFNLHSARFASSYFYMPFESNQICSMFFAGFFCCFRITIKYNIIFINFI